MNNRFSIIHKITVSAIMLAMLSPLLSIGANAQSMVRSGANSLTEDQKIRHVLNRLGFGARPGDVEKVKSIGLSKYIEQQLDPKSIDDAVVEAKLKNIDVIKMSNEELFAKYPAPQAVLQIVARENDLSKGDVAELRAKNKKNAAAMPNDEKAMTTKDNKVPNPAAMSDDERRQLQAEVAGIYRKYDLGRPQQITQQLNASRILRAVYSEKQLQEQMVDFWTNHFNVYVNKAATKWFLPEYDRDVIRPNALGNFKDLLVATAKSPAMLFYLDNFQSVAPNMPTNDNRRRRIEDLNPRQRERIKERLGLNDAGLEARLKQQAQRQQQNQKRGINENYARELMELHTLGVDGGGYTQKDITEVARAFTGWTIIDPRGYRTAIAKMEGAQTKRGGNLLRAINLPENAESGAFYFNERAHDKGEKTILGRKISGGGMDDGLKVIDLLVNHPATAKFIARKLAVKFVSDNPSDALVARVADAFHNSQGDIKTTLRALFTDKEFYAPENYRAKIKTPFELVTSAVRVVGADTNGAQIQAMLTKMGEPLYGYVAPTGYPDMAEDWVNTGALLERMNFAVALASNRIRGTRVDLSGYQAANKKSILAKAVSGVLGGEIAPNTQLMLLKQLDQPLIEPELDAGDENGATMENASTIERNGIRRNRQTQMLAPSGNAEVFKVVGLILGSPDFQRQ